MLRQHHTSDNVVNSAIKYDDLFGSVKQQKEVTLLFGQLLEIRQKLIDEEQLQLENT